MNAILMTAILAFGAAEKPEKDKDFSAAKLDGKWAIVYAEEGGRRNTAWETRPAAIKDGAISYEEEGKKHSMQLKFGPHQTLTAKGLGKDEDQSGKGVYIAGQDYLSISLTTGGKSGEAGSSSDFIMILRRLRK